MILQYWCLDSSIYTTISEYCEKKYLEACYKTGEELEKLRFFVIEEKYYRSIK